MKKIFQIAKLELSLLFYSPIAWLILIIFTIQSSLTFVDLLTAREASQQLGSHLTNLSMDIFGGKGFFSAVKGKLYLYIPLLTMGLMSRELSSGSIKLLFSSPVTAVEIILGKFLSMVYYGAMLCGILLLICIAAYFSVEAIDFPFLLGGILGLFLLLCAYAAIGLYMSSLTTYQVVAAISTLAVLAALNFIGKVGQSIDFVREITYWISISGRTQNFINGIISTKDIIYFILVIGFFLTISVLRLQKGRVNNTAPIRTIKYSLIIILVLGIGYLSSRPTLNRYFDTTRFEQNTLTDSTKVLLQRLKAPVKMTSYVNVLNGFAHLGAPHWRIFERSHFDKYIRYLPDLEMNYVIYYDSTFTSRDEAERSFAERGRRSAIAYDYDPVSILTPEEIHKRINLKPEGNIFVRKLKYKDQQASLRMFYDMIGYPQEAEISAAIKRLLDGQAIIGFLKGHNERSINRDGDKDYKEIFNTLNSRGSLINQGFDVLEVSADSINAHKLTTLVVSDPMDSLSSGDLDALKKYISDGGNMVIGIENANRENLEPFLNYLGISLSSQILQQESKEIEPEVIKARVSSSTIVNSGKFSEDDIVSLPGTLALSYLDSLGFEYEPLLQTRKHQVWLQGERRKDSVFDVAGALTRKVGGEIQKIAVLGDADIFSNAELSRFNLRTENTKFTTRLFSWMSDFKYPIDTTRPDPIDNKILVSRDGILIIKLLITGLLPFIFFAWGGLLLIKRRKN